VATAYDIASPNINAESIVFTTNNTYSNATAHSPIVVLNSIKNATTTLPSARISENGTHVKIITNETYVLGTYDVNYDYEKSAQVWSIDFGFMGVLVILGVVIGLLAKHIIGNKK